MKLNEQRKVYKINSGFLKKSKWNLTLPLETALREYPEFVVSLNDSQLLRWIDELNGIQDANSQIADIKTQIQSEKKKAVTTKTKRKIKDLYKQLNALKFKKDYVCIVMDSVKDYDRCNQGFKINGIQYRRLMGTNGGIKNSTIIYINSALYDEIKKRIDNGRDLNKELVPAKLEAYQALVASGSMPIPQPEGVIVVNDCITHFKDNVILISDEKEGEPELTHIDNYDIEHNNSDGFGLMLPSYSAKVNYSLTGSDTPISGMNTRYAFSKGMLYTFNFIEFAEQKAGTYEIIDVWGTPRDVRKAEVILTASMLKLWDSYKNWEDYYNNCCLNHYEFATPKITPRTLENVRTTSYQYLQSYDFTDAELKELVKPTIDEINDILGADYRKSILYMAGCSLNENNIQYMADDFVKALCINPLMINDPFVKDSIYRNIEKKIENAKKGTIKINGNYAMIGGDAYALAESMFNMPVKGLLKAGEVYHKYWIDNGDTEIVCFRSPMTCHNNIRKMKLNNSSEAAYWFRYINTALIYNAFDTACEAMNGSDFDGDTNFCTNHPLLLAKTKNSKTIICLQKKAGKKVPTETDLIESNKIAFNDEIGNITNRVTTMFDVQAGFSPDSPEYKELEYRIMCGQHFQQCSIDRCKGIISKPMPEYWYKLRKDGEYTDLQKAIVASHKPYFFKYVYPEKKKEQENYVANSNLNTLINYGCNIEEMQEQTETSAEMKKHLDFYNMLMPLGTNACTVNKIAWIFEDEYDGFKPSISNDFNYSILKSGVKYSTQQFKAISNIYEAYKSRISEFMAKAKKEKLEKDNVDIEKQFLLDEFIEMCDCVCPDSRVLCDIVLDLCYKSKNKKSFAWNVAGEQIIKNLLEKNDNTMVIPVKDATGEILFNGERYTMKEIKTN